jgi:hypothetical protein
MIKPPDCIDRRDSNQSAGIKLLGSINSDDGDEAGIKLGVSILGLFANDLFRSLNKNAVLTSNQFSSKLLDTSAIEIAARAMVRGLTEKRLSGLGYC